MILPLLLVNVLLVSLTSCKEAKDAWNVDELFALGKKAYEEQDSQKALDYLQTAITWHKAVLNQRELCFNSCKGSKYTPSTPNYNNGEMHFFHSLNEFSRCMQQCKKSSKQHSSKSPASIPLHRRGFSSKINTTITNGDIHTYVQMALYERNELSLASQHATTNYYLNPHNRNARANYEYYLNREDTCNSQDECKSLESKLYRDLYVNGTDLYARNEFKQMVKSFELSLKYFFMELKKCRKHCEGLVYQPSSTGFMEAMSSLYMSVLECKQNCPSTLGDFRSSEMNTNFFGSYFHYLQFGYFKIDQLQDAVKTLVTQLRIDPNNEVAKMNRAYFQRLKGISRKDYVERKDAEPVLDELMEEKRILDVLKRIMAVDIKEENTPESMDDSKLLEEDFEKYSVMRKLASTTEPDTYLVKESPDDHNGVERIVVDELITQQQCQDLLELTDACIEGDGYAQKSPHTVKEKFEGLTVLNAAKAAAEREVNATQVKLYINSSKQAREIVQKLFKLDKYLHFSFTHLVCRTAKDGAQTERSDLSHPIHADNCILDSEKGECLKESPAFTWRDYSAILYLNDDFEGGDFFFAHSPSNLTIQHSVKPKCGRMVGFSAGKENLHGVNAVTKGRRCAVALWFTLDPNYAEKTFEEAEKTLMQAELK